MPFAFCLGHYSYARVMAFQHRDSFASEYIEIFGSDENGIIDRPLEPLIVQSIRRVSGTTIRPSAIYGLEAITGCGLFGLSVFHRATQENHRLWVIPEGKE